MLYYKLQGTLKIIDSFIKHIMAFYSSTIFQFNLSIPQYSIKFLFIFVCLNIFINHY